MSEYFSFRGWVECEEDDLKAIKRKINKCELKFRKYHVNLAEARQISKSWLFPAENLGWTSYVFFGSELKKTALEYILFQFQEISSLDGEIRCYLCISDDQGKREKMYKIENQEVAEQQLDFLV